ncbi:CRISPR-associated protein Cse2 [Hydrogenophilus thermoluteolus]|uniref:type I-E CRISPR-associated protein Cse2/CasB n=1 Tax=Hydrogenophilus thermoluteolus TaxID=297 RepID=UPI0024A29D6E|nr:type I-E CRISPR-associated protein Cse2/CasB [Hydrogenophilus thermoluteolus]GLW59741.1 CRISPR-associated protein Cse2 [Hydrogenophilus thermoluteolus]
MRERTFAPHTPAGNVLEEWWLALAENRGDRAELCRARSADDAALMPVTVQLVTRLQGTAVAQHGGWIERIPAIAGLAAHLDPDARNAVLADTTPLPERMVRPKGDRPVVSELRFRRLLRTPRHELYRPMMRILALLDHQANLFELAESLFWWGPGMQKQWAFAYFPKLPKTA